jgi:hypothetical protein
MWESLLIELFRTYLPTIIFALICGVSILLYLRTREKGYLAIGIGFVILTTGWIVLKIIALYLVAMVDVGNSYWYLIGLYGAYAVFYLLPASLILIGFIYIYKENKQKNIQQADTSQSL